MDTKHSSRTDKALLAALVVAGLYFGRPVIMPFAIAMLLAFVLVPVVVRLTRLGLPRVLATTVTMLAFAMFVGSLAWFLVGELRDLIVSLPQYQHGMHAKLEHIRTLLSEVFGRALDTVTDLTKTPGSAPPVLVTTPGEQSPWHTVLSYAGPMLDGTSTALLVLVFVFAILLGWDDLRDRTLKLAGKGALHVTTSAFHETATKITSYLQRQLLVNGLYGTAVGVFLWAIGVPNPLVWAIMAGVLRFVPYLGPLVGTLAPILVSFASSDGWTQTLVTGAGMLGLELVIYAALEPWLYGRSTGVSPLAVLLAALFWTSLWGLLGLVMSTPLTVCAFVAGKHFPNLKFLRLLIGDEPALAVHVRLYHRMLSDSQDEAWDIIAKEAKQKDRLHAADELLLPALAMANRAYRDGSITSAQHAQIAAVGVELVEELYGPAESEPEPTNAPRDPAPTLHALCVPARDPYDGVLGRVLAAALRGLGWTVTELSYDQLVSEAVAVVRRESHVLVCIASMAPTHFMHIRSLTKRLSAADPESFFLVTLWGEDVSSPTITERLPVLSQGEASASVIDAIRIAEQRAPLARAPRETEPTAKDETPLPEPDSADAESDESDESEPPARRDAGRRTPARRASS